MPTRRRRVYFDHSYSRRMRMESGLSLSIFLSAGIFLLALLASVRDLASRAASWLLPDGASFQYGAISTPEAPSLLATLCEILMALSAAYLVLALFIKFLARPGRSGRVTPSLGG